MMDNDRSGLNKDLATAFAYLECQVGIFIVSRCIALIQTTNLMKILGCNGDTGTGAIIDFTQIMIIRSFRVVSPAIVPTGTVAEYHTARFLQAAVRVNQTGTHQTGLWLSLEGIDQFIQPPFGHLGVIVEEHQVPSEGFFCTTITAAHKPQVFPVSQVCYSLDPG